MVLHLYNHCLFINEDQTLPVGKGRVFRIFENRFTVITKAFQVLVCFVCNNILVWKRHGSVPI